MFVVRLFRFTFIFVVFLVVYLPITLNPKIFERKSASAASDIVGEEVAFCDIHSKKGIYHERTHSSGKDRAEDLCNTWTEGNAEYASCWPIWG